jgi:hypothetical protein
MCAVASKIEVAKSAATKAETRKIKARKIEATLFYHADPELAFKQLADDLVNAFHSTSVPLHPRLITQTELGCTIGGLTLTLLRHPEPVVTPPLPHEACTQTRSIAFTLRISCPDEAAQTSTRLALCYVAVMQILNRARANRIHWGYSNVIYTTDSFLLETSGRHMTPNGGPRLRRPRTLGPGASEALFAKTRRAAKAPSAEQTTPCRMAPTNAPNGSTGPNATGMSLRLYEKWCAPAPTDVALGAGKFSQLFAGRRH